jgi:hypothetical protein
MARDHDLRGPFPRLDSQKLELQREERRVLLGLGDRGVDALDERRDDSSPFG